MPAITYYVFLTIIVDHLSAEAETGTQTQLPGKYRCELGGIGKRAWLNGLRQSRPSADKAEDLQLMRRVS